MKLFFCFLLLLPFASRSQESLNMTLLSNFDLDGLPTHYGSEYSDCWGYHHSENGTDVAILGGMQDIFFIDVTIPAAPVLIHTHHVQNTNGTTNTSLWRDFKTYQHYAYASADEGDSGLLIFDLSQVPAAVTLVTQMNAFWSRTHNIYIDEQHGRLYAAGSNTQSNGLRILDLTTSPTVPTLLASIPMNNIGGGYVHDVHVRDNIAYCSHGSLGKVQMYDFSNLPTFSVVGVIENYPEQGYNHSGWLNEAGTLFAMADETHGSDLKLVDVTDPLNISSDDINTFYSELEGPNAPGASVAHNPFILGDLVFVAYYHDGVQVFNIADPNDIELLAYYDTYPDNTGYTSYDGCWGVYPFLPSGIIIGSDQNYGLYVLEIQDITLDIDFLSFRALRKDEAVQLQWSVVDASFGNTFEVKRSIDNGITFQKIGNVKLTDNQFQYSFLDRDVSSHQKYMYRIDFVQLDGKRINSPIRSIIPGRTASTIKVVNPISSTLVLDVYTPVESLQLGIYDMEGKLAWSHVIDEPRARMEIGIDNVPAGQYALTMQWPGGAENVLIQVIK